MLATVSYAAIARWQLIAMQGQLNQMKAQSTETQNQTKLLRQQVSGTEGAVIELGENPTIWPDLGQISWRIVNVGHAPAEPVTISGAIEYMALPSGNPIGSGPEFAKTFPFVPHTTDPVVTEEGRPALNVSSYNPAVFRVPSEESKLFAQTKLAVYVRGKITYFNGFDEPGKDGPRELDLCYYMFGYQMPASDTDRQMVTNTSVVRCNSDTPVAIMIRHALFDIDKRQGKISPDAQYSNWSDHDNDSRAPPDFSSLGERGGSKAVGLRLLKKS